MKTVHGADFYANKKHKGGAGPKDNSEDSGAGGSSPLPGDEMPLSAKTESVSSPSIKSEVCTKLFLEVVTLENRRKYFVSVGFFFSIIYYIIE